MDLSVHPVLKTHTGYCFFKAAMRMRAKLDQGLHQHGLLIPQFAILRLLEIMGPVSQVELGKSMGTDKTSIVKFLDGLEKHKMIMRAPDPGDRRVKTVSITPAGLKLLKKAMKTRDQTEDQCLAPLTRAERETLRRLVSKLLS